MEAGQYRDAALDAAAALISERGLAGITMSEIAERAGIGRATLYRHFSDVDALLLAWHARQIDTHLQQLAEVRYRTLEAGRLEAVLRQYALFAYQHESTELAAAWHRADHAVDAHQHLQALIRDLISEGARTGQTRTDVAPKELASYCLHALTAAATLPSRAAVERLVSITLDGLRPPAV
jgi:AcrR family transcriptional regulator